MASLQHLPTDISLTVLSHLSFSDILSIRQTCKSFYQFSHLRSIWISFLTHQVQEQNIPVPGISQISLDSLSVAELERLIFRALRLRQNWISQAPVSRRESILAYEAPPTQIGIISLQFVPGNNQYLVSLIYTNPPPLQPPSFTLQCWDLAAQPTPRCIATRTMLQRSRLGLNMNSNSSSIDIALQTHDHLELLTIDPAAEDPRSSFLILTEFLNRPDFLLGIYGSVIFSTDEQNRLFLWDVMAPDSRLELQAAPQAGSVFEFIYLGNLVIVFRRSGVEIFHIDPPIPSGSTVTSPISSHTWQWNIDTINVAISSYPSGGQRATYPPINVLLRFGSMLPWPVNMLHFYRLDPSSVFDERKPIGPGNIPYELPPTLKRTIGSPVNLFSNYHMAVGPRGTALWLDSHTEDQQNQLGQRLAGTFIPDESTYPDPSSIGAEPVPVPDSETVETTMESSIFRYNDSDDWVRVAMDEEEGRVAIGRKDGSIMLLEYA